MAAEITAVDTSGINDGSKFSTNEILKAEAMNDIVGAIGQAATQESVNAACGNLATNLLTVMSDLGQLDAIPNFTTTKEVGGIQKGTDLKNKTVVQILNLLLCPYVAPSGLSITINQSAGTYEYGTQVVISSVTPTFIAGSKAINLIKIGTSSGGSDLFKGSSATSKTAISLTNNKTFDGTSGGTIYCSLGDGETTLTANAKVDYTYYYYAKLNTSTIPNDSELSKKNATDGDDTYSYSSGQYLWLYSRSSGKKIQTYVAGSWADVNTTSAGQVTITLNSGITATYYAYRTDKFTANGSARYRLK